MANIVISRIKIFLGSVTLKKFQLNQFLMEWINKVIVFASYYIGTLTGLLIGIFLYTSIAQDALHSFDGSHTIFLAIGGMIGTMLALVFSLLIIPIQRAAEVFSSSVIRL